jgi:hypothetical protein
LNSAANSSGWESSLRIKWNLHRSVGDDSFSSEEHSTATLASFGERFALKTWHGSADEQPIHSANLPSPKDGGPDKFTQYEFIDSRELAHRLTVPASWIRDQVRARSEDPLPHVNLGKYVRFLWGSPALELWIRRRIVVGNNRRLGRTRRKEQE